MAKYLDPKADLTYKKVFGEHKDLAAILSAVYGYPQWLLNDEYVIALLNQYADSQPIHRILYSIDKYLDQISRERTRENAAEKRGLEKGRAEGLAEGEARERLKNARNLKQLGVPVETIAQATGLSLAEIEAL